MSDALDRIAARLAELEHTVHVLKTAPRANRTAVRDGYTRWLPAGDATNPSLSIGSNENDVFMAMDTDGDSSIAEVFLGSEGGIPRLYVSNPDRSAPALDIIDGEMLAPLLTCAWQPDTNTVVDTAARPIVTSASYVTVLRTILPICTGSVNTWIDVYCAANTADVKITATHFGGGLTPVTVVEETGLTGTQLVFGPWDLPADIVADDASPIGRLVDFKVEARRTAGAGNVAVAARIPLCNA